jgi:hypothetical protein
VTWMMPALPAGLFYKNKREEKVWVGGMNR